MLYPDFPIETRRLLIRPLDATSDVDDVFAYQSRADVCRFIPYEPRTREQVAERLADPERTRSTLDKDGQVLSLAVELRETGRVIGDVVLIYSSAEHQCAEIGYVFNPDQHGKGYATEACHALLALAFDGLKVRRVIARIDDRNTASGAVLRRIGMRQEAHLIETELFKGEWTSEIDFAILDHEWRSRR